MFLGSRSFVNGMILIGNIFIWRSTSFKEQSAHVASVKNILENHASYLMSGKELSKLVAFVKGTQFDLVVRYACTFYSRICFTAK